MKTILIAHDFSDLSGPVLRYSSDLAKAWQAKLLLLHTEPPQTGYIYYSPGYTYHGILGFGLDESVRREIEVEQLRNDKHALELIEKRLRDDGVEVEAMLMTGDPAQAILETAEERDVDMIVVGAHAHGAFYKLLFGCVDSELVRRASCPVLVIPETAVDREK
jgi:nucleotide-binding universal stress UspA family protein